MLNCIVCKENRSGTAKDSECIVICDVPQKTTWLLCSHDLASCPKLQMLLYYKQKPRSPFIAKNKTEKNKQTKTAALCFKKKLKKMKLSETGREKLRTGLTAAGRTCKAIFWLNPGVNEGILGCLLKGNVIISYVRGTQYKKASLLL